METTLSTTKLLDAKGAHVAIESGTFAGGQRADVWITSSLHYHNQKWGGESFFTCHAMQRKSYCVCLRAGAGNMQACWFCLRMQRPLAGRVVSSKLPCRSWKRCGHRTRESGHRLQPLAPVLRAHQQSSEPLLAFQSVGHAVRSCLFAWLR